MADVLLSGKATVTPVGTDNAVIIDDPGGADAVRLAAINTIPVTLAQLEGSLVAGDILYANGADSVTRLAKGSDTEVLTLAAGVPSWAPAGAGGTVQGTDATYDIQAANDGAVAGAGRGENSVDLSTIRSNSFYSATGVASVIGGGEDNVNAGAHGVVAGGEDAVQNGAHSFIGGGKSNRIDGDFTNIPGGSNNDAGGDYAYVPGGYGNRAEADYSSATGREAKSDKWCQQSLASARFAANGDAQTSILIARNSTINATPTELFLNGASLRTTIASDTSWLFKVSVVARRTDADGESAGYTFAGVLDNDAGTVTLGSAVTKTVVHEDTAAWDCNVTADDTNDALVITVTGEAAKTIRWVARIELVEVSG